MNSISIGLIGDFNPNELVHKAIPNVLYYSGLEAEIEVNFSWINTFSLDSAVLLSHNLHGIWCVPGSPYKNPQGVIDLIKFARELKIPFLGTCGGYQHAIIEFAQNVLNKKEASHAEDHPDAQFNLISKMSCSLIEVEENVSILPKTELRNILRTDTIKEKYHCSYGLNPDHIHLFDNTGLVFSAFDSKNEAKAFELKGHPFFMGTAFQPERNGLKNISHPLILKYLNSCLSFKLEISGYGYNRSDY